MNGDRFLHSERALSVLNAKHPHCLCIKLFRISREIRVLLSNVYEKHKLPRFEGSDLRYFVPKVTIGLFSQHILQSASSLITHDLIKARSFFNEKFLRFKFCYIPQNLG